MDNAIPKTPRHVAIIMDGNGRWARRRGLDRVEGHVEGAQSARKAVELCIEAGIPNLTLYAFSTENWSRPAGEVDFLMHQLSRFLVERRSELVENGVGLHSIGRTDELPDMVQQELSKTCEVTQGGKKLNLYLALNYGGRAEIVDACKKILNEAEGSFDINNIDEQSIADALYAPDAPYPDLLIRTGGEMRISNFLLWQIAYTELYFTKTLWPDFCDEDFYKAISEFGRRERRFGRVVD